MNEITNNIGQKRSKKTQKGINIFFSFLKFFHANNTFLSFFTICFLL